MKLKINHRLILMVTAVVLVVVASLSVIIFATFKGNLDENISERSKVSTQLVAERIHSWFLPVYGQLNTVESYVRFSPETVKPVIKTIMDEVPEITSVYWGSEKPLPEGGFFLESSGWTPPAGWDHSRRPWYLDAKKTQGIYLTDPYIDANTGKIVVSAALKVEDFAQRPAGVVGLDLFITTVSEMVTSEKITENGDSFLVDAAGLYVTNKDDSLVLKANAFEGTALSGAQEHILGSDNAFGFTGDGKYYFASRKILDADWTFVTYGPVLDIYRELWVFLATLLAAALCCVVAGGLIAIAFARTISVPVTAVSEAVRRFADGDFKLDGYDFGLLDKMRRRSDELGETTAAMDTKK